MKIKQRSHSIIVIALIIILAAICYWPSLSAPFVFDDIRSIVSNYPLHLDQLSVAKLARLNKSALGGNRPLAILSLALNYYFGGLNPFGYHLFNLIIHILTAIAVYSLTIVTLNLPKLKERYQEIARPIAAISSLVFVLHPVNTQAVTYTVQRMASLACLFFLLSIISYLHARQAEGKSRCIWWIFMGISAICAFASKENSATLPFFILLYELLFFESSRKQRHIFWATPLIFLGLAAGYTGFDLSHVLRTSQHTTYSQHLLTQLRVTVHYLSLIVFPHPNRLNLDYDFAYSASLFKPVTTFFSLVLVLALIALAIYLFRKRPFISLCLAWFLGNLAIESGLILADVVFEHRLYLPIIGILWLISMGLAIGWKNLAEQKSWAHQAGVISLAGLLLLLGTWTYQRNLIWVDPLTLWQDVVKKSPNKARAHNNLANAYGSLGQYDKAIIECKRAIELNPNYSQTYNNLGMIYASLKDDKQAIKYYEQAITRNPKLIEAHNNLASAYLRQGEYKKAIASFKFMEKENPFFPATYNNLGTAYHKLGKTEEAVKYFQKALEIDPSFGQAYLNIGAAYAQQGKLKDAMSNYQKALDLMPESAELYYNLGRAYFLLKQPDQARQAYRKALELDPKLAHAYFGLGKLESSIGRYGEAIEAYQEGVMLAPEWAQGHNELGSAYYMNDQYQEAIEAYKQALMLEPRFVQVHNNLGLAYTALKMYQEAIKEHQLALEKNPNMADTYSYIGFIYLHYLKQPKKALPYLRNSLNLLTNPEEKKQLENTIKRLEAERDSF